MKIECNRIEISNNDSGLQIEFLEKKYEADPESLDYNNISEVVNSIGPYLLIQRTYTEDEFDKDYYYVESSFLEESGELRNFVFTLNEKKLKFDCENNVGVEIKLRVDEKELERLIKALRLFTKFDGKFLMKK